MDGPRFKIIIDAVVLLDDLDDTAAMRFDQNRAAVYDGISMFSNAVFRRHVVIGHALFRQDRADPDILAVLVRRTVLLDDIAAKARTLVDAENAVHAANHSADHATDDRTNGTGRSFALP